MRVLLSLVCLVLIYGCSPEDNTGPVEVRWDREVCQRCSMGIGDNRFAAQIRGGAQHKVYKFDDIGCAVIWLEQQAWKDADATEIWVSDYHDKNWLDARQASYVRVLHSPMGYGLGAVAGQVKDALSFAEAIAHIEAVENKEHRHGQAHQHQNLETE